MASETTVQDEPAGLHPTLRQFDSLIVRAAYRASLRITGSGILAEDLAQEVRSHLAEALNKGKVKERAVRVLITNAIRDRIRFERSRFQLTSTNAAELDDRNAVFSQVDSTTRPDVLTISKWVASQPRRLRAIFELLYGFGYTHREASSVLGLSQPRITQLHQELIERGRLDLKALAA